MNVVLCLRIAAAVCAVLVGWTGAARLAVAAGDADAREHLARERRSIEVTHLERERQCAAQFVVTACIETARVQKREALLALDAREAALDDAERRQRALDRQARIDAKVARQQAASAPDRELLPLVPADAARVTRAAVLPRAASQPEAPRVARPTPAEVKAREAESRAGFDQRQREAQDRQKAAAARQRERDRAGKPAAAPLPPLESSGAGTR